MNAKSAFVVAGVVLVGLVVGVPILGAVFAQGGPFGQLVGVTTGTCEYVPSGRFSSGISIADPSALGGNTYVLDRRVVVSDGTHLGRLTDAEIVAVTLLGTPLTNAGDSRTIASGNRRFIVAITSSSSANPISEDFGNACSSSSPSLRPLGSGHVSGSRVVDIGKDYTSPPTAIFPPSPNGITASGIGVLNNNGNGPNLASITITEAGSGYVAAVPVSFVGGGGGGSGAGTTTISPMGHVEVVTDGHLSTNRYAGVLAALILLVPLAVIIYFAMRFVHRRQR